MSNNDKQILSSTINLLLTNMGDNVATTIRSQNSKNLTACHIMQYLEDSYGALGPSHLEYITTHLLQ